MAKSTPPSIAETAFDCPYCGAYTTQHWHQLRTTRIDGKTPDLPDVQFRNRIAADSNAPPEAKSHILGWIDKMHSGLIFLNDNKEDPYSSLETIFS